MKCVECADWRRHITHGVIRNPTTRGKVKLYDTPKDGGICLRSTPHRDSEGVWHLMLRTRETDECVFQIRKEGATPSDALNACKFVIEHVKEHVKEVH